MNAPAGMSFEGDPGYPGNHYTFGKADVIEPRIGVIFDPIGNGKMTIRAGYGIFYDAPQLFFNTRYSNSPPFGSTISLAGPLPFASPWATYPGGIPFPGLSELSPTVPFPTEGVYVNSPLHIQPMYLQQFNASVQRQIGSWLFSGNYLGNTTRHLPTSYEADPAIYDGKATLAKPNTNPRRLLALQNGRPRAPTIRPSANTTMGSWQITTACFFRPKPAERILTWWRIIPMPTV